MDIHSPSEKQQFELLSTISNYHFHGYPRNKNPSSIKKPLYLTYAEHMFHDANSRIDEDGIYIRQHTPASPRNCLLYHISTGQDAQLYQLVKYLHWCDQGDEEQYTTNHHGDELSIQPPKKKRKQSARMVSVSRMAIFAEVGEDFEIGLNKANSSRTIFTNFTEQLLADGIIKWRFHSDTKDICVMNDYNPITGLLLPQGFVHVTCTTFHGQQPLIHCTCTIFNLIKRAAHQMVKLWPGEDAVPDDSLTCMHCRFFKENLMDAYNQIGKQSTYLSTAMSMAHKSLQFMNDEVLLFGNVIVPSFTKFSVKEDDNYSLLSVSFNNHKCFVTCTDGLCAAGLKNKRNISRDKSKDKKKKMQCSHLITFYRHIDYIKFFFPDYFTGQDDQHMEIHYNGDGIEDINNDDVNIGNNVTGNFDVNTGLWNFKALTTHKPKRMMDPKLILATQHRNIFIGQNPVVNETGLYGVYHLKPSGKDAEGKSEICACGYEYKAEEGNYETDYVLQGSGILYTRNGPVRVEYYNLHCKQGICQIPYTTSAEEKCIFMLTKSTLIGDEIAWDFIQMVIHNKCSFTAFCNEMTRRYQTNNMMAGPFMSPKTFIRSFFGWMSAHKIDFRKEVDPWCMYSPKILACDGTHIGVSMRHMNIKPIEKQDLPDVIYSAKHQCNNRVLIPNVHKHKHLRYLCKKQLNKLKPSETYIPEVEQEKSWEILEYVAAKSHPIVHQLLKAFVYKTQHDAVLEVLARLLYMMSGDAALSSVLPFLSHDLIEECIKDMEGNAPTPHSKLLQVENFCIELAKLMIVSQKHGCSDLCLAFCKYLLSKIKDIHKTNRPVPEVKEIPGTYDPRSGTAYYFSEFGNQLRKMPVYKVASKLDICGTDGCDEEPEVDKCQKYFPRVNYGGFGYIFLWFCPVHGHSYGFHCINGGEGRKDVFSSLYKYLEKPPEHIFYDFACQLHEYCLNREPELFKNTRFWHDLFHSIGHVCGINFKSGRVRGLEGVNTEICEQWNSFLQCIKYTGSHLTQDHFSFLLQFFIALQNREKTEKFRTQASIVVAGHL